ncbi:MAG TPA: hypothetical protein VN948_07840 [Terriglobales bacterium]|nr:hypothetical protein [Terriglobales bacterium]
MKLWGYVASCLFAVALLSQAVQGQQPPEPRKLTNNSSNAIASTPDFGAIANGVYHNTAFGFTCKIPYGWVDRTPEISEDPSPDSNARKKSILLLAVFERPPEASGDSVNSAVVVAAEAASSYPGLRNAEHYFGPLTELTKSKGLKVVNEPYDYSMGAMQLVRGDFSKPLGNLTMHQSTLVMMEKGYVVSFTFIGGSEDEVDELVEGLSFGRKETPAPHK